MLPRSLDFVNIGYIDDSLLCGDTRECQKNVFERTSLMKELGFMINVEKSVLVPQKQITSLGNIIDSDQMIVILPTEKQEIIVNGEPPSKFFFHFQCNCHVCIIISFKSFQSKYFPCSNCL
jgi:hypothetical protein